MQTLDIHIAISDRYYFSQNYPVEMTVAFEQG